MFLTESIVDREGLMHKMVGVIPASVKMQTRLAALGYRDVAALHDSVLLAKGERIRGHEYHYSTVEYHSHCMQSAYEVSGVKGKHEEGYCNGNLLAAYTHLHFASNPGVAKHFIEQCRAYRARRMH